MSVPQPGPNREPTRERARWTVVTPARSLVPLVLAVGAVGLVLHLLQGILLPFVIAAVTAYVCVPLIDWVMARTRLPRWPVALCVLALLMGAAALLVLLGLPVLLGQAQSLVTDLHGAVADLMRALIGKHSVHVLGSTLDAERVSDQIVGALQHWTNGGQLLTVIGWGAAAAFGFMLVWVLMGYFLVDAPAIASGLRWLVPPGRRALAEQVWQELDPILRRYFVGVAVVVAYATTAAYLGLELLLGLHHALALALLTGVLEVIPVIGPLAAAVVAGLAVVGLRALHGGHPAPSAVTHPPTSARTSTAVVTLVPVGAQGFEENPSGANLAIDNSSATAWQTHWYIGNPVFGGLQQGSGLILDMGRSVRLSSVTVTFGSVPGADVQIKIGNPANPVPPQDAPDTAQAIANSMTTVAQQSNVSNTVTFPVTSTATGRYVLIWFTKLPPMAGQSNKYQAEIFNVVVKGVG